MISEEKQILRVRMREAVRAMPCAEREGESARLRERLACFEPWQKAREVLLFAPLPSEPALWPDAAAGKAAGLPRIEEKGLRFYRCDPGTMLRTGMLGVSEPEVCFDGQMEPGRADVIVVPGLAFDRKGRRLGRGGGYYDRLLETLRGPLRVGVCFTAQLVDRVPCEWHDAQVDVVITPAEVRIACEPDSR